MPPSAVGYRYGRGSSTVEYWSNAHGDSPARRGLGFDPRWFLALGDPIRNAVGDPDEFCVEPIALPFGVGWSPSVETIEELVLGLEPIRSKGDNATRSFATTITMTAEQLDAATTGEGVHFSQNGVEFVVIRFEVFDRVKELLQSDQRELRMILGRSSEGNGWDEPGMDAYDSCPEKP